MSRVVKDSAELVKGDAEFVKKAQIKVAEWLKSFQDEKPKLILENRKEQRYGASKNSGHVAMMSKMEKKRKKQEDIKKKYTCKKAVYENAKMLGPDGVLLCHTEIKKARWYV